MYFLFIAIALHRHPQRLASCEDWPFFRVWFLKQENTWCDVVKVDHGVIGPFFRMSFVKHQSNWHDSVLKRCMVWWRGRPLFLSMNREFRLSFKWYIEGKRSKSMIINTSPRVTICLKASFWEAKMISYCPDIVIGSPSYNLQV